MWLALIVVRLAGFEKPTNKAQCSTKINKLVWRYVDPDKRQTARHPDRGELADDKTAEGARNNANHMGEDHQCRNTGQH